MAIPFARLEFVKRSSGKNACYKAAYNARCRIEFQGTEWQLECTYNWSKQEPPAYHKILLPQGVDPKFLDAEILWNAAEQKEVRRNSQTALEMVIALPDDQIISLDDRKHLVDTFMEEHFVKKGLAVQIDIHRPENKQGNLEEPMEHNWHAHALITTRRFKANGLEFDDHKARELMPVVRGGKVVAGELWGKLWARHQNQYFEQKGIALRVDMEGVVSQKHLGPVRLRARALSLLDEHDARVSLNALESEDPLKVLEKITQTKNIFTAEDIDHFLHKHVNPEKISEVRETFWKQPEITQLIDRQTNKSLNKFTTQKIIEEEKQLIRLADQLHSQSAHAANFKKVAAFSNALTPEQKLAFENILRGQKLSCLEGYAGTGKSNLLKALKDTYESQKYCVRGIGPDSATAEVLKEKGFSNAENVYRFLFSISSGKLKIQKHEVWMIDEVGKLGTRPMLELLKCAKRFDAQLILAGDSAQLPSVERGLGYKVFSERYGAQRLENIQRQSDESEREIAKKLARGEMGAALDAIWKNGNIKWQSSKEESIESLIKEWATNRALNPNESSLIIAHTNREIKVLNELARLYRKEAGELTDREFECETAYGKVYVGVGDRIEFRKNDNMLKVNNGTKGILVAATEDNFTVQVKNRIVTFDPREYRTFQLGYATTFYRSQGDSADKAYVLHSSMMNKESFYVGLTRHFKKVECFVSEQETKNLADLKRQSLRRTQKDSTLTYLNDNDLEKQQAQALKEQRVAEFKSSDSMLVKAKGFGLSAWEEVRGKTSKIIERYKDKQPDHEFFNPKFEKQSALGKVQEVRFEDDLKFDSEKIKADFKKIAESSAPSVKIAKSKSNDFWKKLPEEKRNFLRGYYKSSDKASALYTIVRSEEEAGGKSAHFSEWHQACRERNSHAFELLRVFNTKEIRSSFSPKSLEILQERSMKHEMTQNKDTLADLESKLKENLDSLVHKLFPEGPTRRDSKGLRFGTNGSLAVVFTGKGLGCFHDFEKKEGGGPLQLIQKRLFCSNAEAIAWAKDFMGQAPTQAPVHYFLKKSEKDQDWVSLKPSESAPTLDKISKNLAHYYMETARYQYCDHDGGVLFYTLRLQDKAGKKIVLPLSYGHYKDNDDEPNWSLKGYQANKKPIYNLQLLQAYPKSKVLVVEGEKTADAASKMFPPEKMICITWSGGASAVNKTDWRPLFMRDVIIWPDNDKAGFEASETLCKELRKIGVKSLHEVDKSILAKELPPKWDLADPLPQDKPTSFIKDMILRAQNKAVGLEQLMAQLKANALQIDPKIAHEVLFTVEERLRCDLEKKFGQRHWEINSEILKETVQILKDPSQIKAVLNADSYQEKAAVTEFKYDYTSVNQHSLDQSKGQELDI